MIAVLLVALPALAGLALGLYVGALATHWLMVSALAETVGGFSSEYCAENRTPHLEKTMDEIIYVPPADPPEPALALTLLYFAEWLATNHLLLTPQQSGDERSLEDWVDAFQATMPDVV